MRDTDIIDALRFGSLRDTVFVRSLSCNEESNYLLHTMIRAAVHDLNTRLCIYVADMQIEYTPYRKEYILPTEFWLREVEQILMVFDKRGIPFRLNATELIKPINYNYDVPYGGFNEDEPMYATTPFHNSLYIERAYPEQVLTARCRVAPRFTISDDIIDGEPTVSYRRTVIELPYAFLEAITLFVSAKILNAAAPSVPQGTPMGASYMPNYERAVQVLRENGFDNTLQYSSDLAFQRSEFF